MTTPNNEEFDQSLQDWLVTEQLFKESGLEQTNAENENNDFLRNFNAIGRFLASHDAPIVQFASYTDKQTVLSFDKQSPVDLPSPFFPADDEKQMWVIRNVAVEDLESFANDSPQISSMTAYGYNQAERMMLFNLEQQRVLGINGTAKFAPAMVRGLAVEHAMEPWNAQRKIYLVGFGIFGHALKEKLATYHSQIHVIENLTDLEYNPAVLNQATIFSIGQDAHTVSEFVKITTEYSLGLVADVQLGGVFTYFQESDDDGAIEPGNIWIQPFLIEDDSEDYAAVMNSYRPAENEEHSISDDDLAQWLSEDPTTETEVAEPVAETTEESPQPPAVEEPELPNGYLQLMGEKAQLVAKDGTRLSGLPAQMIAYTYLQQTYGQTPPTFADLCVTVWGTEPTGKDKSKLSARRKRTKEKLHEIIPDAELILARDGWEIKNITTDIDLLATNPSSFSPAPALTQEAWAEKYYTALEESIAQAQTQN